MITYYFVILKPISKFEICTKIKNILKIMKNKKDYSNKPQTIKNTLFHLKSYEVEKWLLSENWYDHTLGEFATESVLFLFCLYAYFPRKKSAINEMDTGLIESQQFLFSALYVCLIINSTKWFQSIQKNGFYLQYYVKLQSIIFKHYLPIRFSFSDSNMLATR